MKINTLDAKGGNDLVIDNSHYDRNINAGAGNDTIIAMENGNKDLFGDSGNDKLFSGTGKDTLRGGQGDDVLSGGEGDDRYFVDRSDGHTTIEDSGGTDTLFLLDIDVDELCFTPVEDGVYITLKNSSFTTFSIKLMEGKGDPEEKIEKIKTGNRESVLEDLIKTAISSFSAQEKQQLINLHNEFIYSENMTQLALGH